MKNILRTIDLLDKCGLYRMADRVQSVLIKTAAAPYNMVALDELPYSARNVPWAENEDDYEQFDEIFWKELKQRIPEYRHLNTDEDEEDNLEGEMHGENPIPGPAYTWQGDTYGAPSMTGDLDAYKWDNIRDENVGPDYWKNLQPRR